MSEPAAGPDSPASPNFRAPAVPATPPPTLPDHELLSVIGRGAYGEVWRAQNRTTKVARAVKIVRRSEFEDERPCQREFEGLLKYEPISRSHPGLVQILHVGRNEAEGYFYYVMELADDASGRSGGVVESWSDGKPGSPEPPARHSRTSSLDAFNSGPPHHSNTPQLHDSNRYAPRTLRSDLKTRGRLPVAECLAIGHSLAAALRHLHEHGLVHRDVKPSNIIFVNGQAKLADIGLVTAADTTLSCVGTEGYIPPEGPGKAQADLYSLGKTLYEIATGLDRRQFPELPPDLGHWPDRMWLLELNEVIVKACAADPKQRYHEAAEVERDLARLQEGRSIHWRRTLESVGRQTRRAAPVAVVAVLSLFVLSRMWRQDTAQRSTLPPEKASVFVLPFRSEGTNEVSVDLGRVTDAFIDSLASIEGVRGSPRKSGWRWLDEDEIRHALARTNDMRHVLTSRIASSNDTLSLTLRLYPRRSDQPLWTESFSGKTNELIALEDRALRGLAVRLGLTISPSERQRIDTLLTNNLEALRWYQQAWAAYALKAGTKSGYKEARELAQKARGLDPRFLAADLHDAYMLRQFAQDHAPSDVWPDVQRRMVSILDQDDTYPDALENLAGYTLCYLRDWESAYALWNRELLFQPKEVRFWVGAFWCRNYGWFAEGRVYQELSEEPEPTGPDQRYLMASARWVERRYAEGVRIARRSVQMYPGNAEGYQWLAHCLVANSNYVEGIEATYKAQEDWEKQEITALRAVAFAQMGQAEKAREVLEELLKVERGRYLQPYFVARVYSALKEKDKALDWLEKAEQDKSEYLLLGDFAGGLRVDPAWDDFQDEPRFKELLKKVGLDQWPRPKPKDWPPAWSR